MKPDETEFVNPLFPHVKVTVLASHVARYAAWQGGHPEAELMRWAKSNFQDTSKSFLDIGANCGFWTAHMSSCFSHVYAFEPNPSSFARLVSSVERSKIGDKVTLYNVAISEYEGRHTLYMTSLGDGGHASLYSSQNKDDALEIRTVSLSDVLEETRIGLIKIDVEGAELAVLRGAERFLKNAGLPPILFESWDDTARGGAAFRDTASLLSRYGYDVQTVNWPEEYLATKRK